jgi:hypothetical protein
VDFDLGLTVAAALLTLTVCAKGQIVDYPVDLATEVE